MNICNNYKFTIRACFISYITQAIVNNFVPLLFVYFGTVYGIPLSQISLLVAFNFGIQLTVDMFASKFVDRIGYRVSILCANLFCGLGLCALAILPILLPDAFAGIVIAVVIYAVGGGLLEVLVSPIVESCPSDNKAATMSLLHSFYCWGHVGVVLLSTLYFAFVGIESWTYLALFWAIVPFLAVTLFCFVPIVEPSEAEEKNMSAGALFRSKIFYPVLLMMFCAGACEQAVSQWASAFAESALQVDKTIGDLAGTLMFATLMGLSRVGFAKLGDRLNINRGLIFSALLCLGSYLLISLPPSPLLSLIGCGICGFSVGLLWPGTFSLASATIPRGGTAMFALLALAGDLGCMSGPTYVGMLSDGVAGGDLKLGILCAVLFPLLLLVSVFWNKKSVRRNPDQKVS